MRHLLEHIAVETGSKLDGVLHVGAGRGRELDHYLRREADRVLLVEANPKLTAQLRARAKNAPQIEVFDAAVAANGGDATLWFLNKPQETSLFRPTRLLERYPNLRVTHNESVRTITLGNLVERLSPDPSGNNLLVLELQGAELSVLSSIPAKLLQKFSWIITRSSNEALYDDGAQLEEVESVLRTFGFARATPAEDLPGLPFQEVLFRRNAFQIQLAELNDLLKEREEKIRALNESLQNQTRIAVDRHAEVERLIEERDVLARQRLQDQKVTESLQLRARAVGREHAQLALQHLQDVDQLTKARDEQAKLAGDRQALLEQIGTAKEELTRQIVEAKKHIQSLSKSSDEQIRIANERQSQLERLTKERDEQAKFAIDRKVEMERLTRARDEQAKLAGDRQALLERLGKAKEELTRQLAEAREQIQSLSKANDEQARLAGERQAQLERLTREHNEQAKFAIDRKVEMERLTRARDEQAKLAQTKEAEVDRLTRLLQDNQARIGHLESQLAEMAKRQILLNEEMVKAEGQIDVIKYVLLREPDA
ncbi:MAG: FkbM family methyltransferase [Gammaproteobacteria bacterium]|nr:FkbM family methyltransferase [Gammaproteobacteria bacterium]